MKRMIIAAMAVLFAGMLSACSVYPPGTIVIVQGETTPAETTPAETTPTVTTPVVTTPAITTPVATTPVVTTPAITTPVVTTPVETTPAITTPVATTPAATTPAITTPVVTTPAETAPATDYSTTLFVISVNTKKYHLPTCRYAKQIKEENKKEVVGLSEFNEEYTFCKVCLPDLQSE